jgi:uncharacterized FlaG/YvyC family protein
MNMASDGSPVTVPALTRVSQAPLSSSTEPGGKLLPQSGNAVSKPATAQVKNASGTSQTAHVVEKADLPTLVTQLNKYLNDSGRPNQFRVDPASRNQTIQEINPATGEVIGEFAVTEFPALARSLGVSGVFIDSHA